MLSNQATAHNKIFFFRFPTSLQAANFYHVALWLIYVMVEMKTRKLLLYFVTCTTPTQKVLQLKLIHNKQKNLLSKLSPTKLSAPLTKAYLETMFPDEEVSQRSMKASWNKIIVFHGKRTSGHETIIIMQIFILLESHVVLLHFHSTTPKYQ